MESSGAESTIESATAPPVRLAAGGSSAAASSATSSRSRRCSSLLFIGTLATFASIVSPYEFNPPLTAEVLDDAREPPSWDHLFGTDKLGRDQFTRVLYALQKSLHRRASASRCCRC